MLGAPRPANLRQYAAAHTALDDDVGAVLAEIDQKQLIDNTLVVFTSTCGALLGTPWAVGRRRCLRPAQHVRGGHQHAHDLELARTRSPWRAARTGERLRPGAHPLRISPPPIRRPATSAAEATWRWPPARPLPKKLPWRTTVFSQYQNTGMARDRRYKVVVRDGGKGPGELYDLMGGSRERQ